MTRVRVCILELILHREENFISIYVQIGESKLFFFYKQLNSNFVQSTSQTTTPQVAKVVGIFKRPTLHYIGDTGRKNIILWHQNLSVYTPNLLYTWLLWTLM